MSDDLVQRLRDAPAAEYIEQLMQKAADRIETLAYELGAEVQRSYEQLQRIEVLEAALRKIAVAPEYPTNWQTDIARRILEGANEY